MPESKKSIIRAYNDLVATKGGTLPGAKVFVRETGISTYHWKGGYWRSWSEFQADAGHSPNSPTQRITDEALLQRFAELALEKRRLPTHPDLDLKRKIDPTFPGKGRFDRWGGRDALLPKVAVFCEGKEQFAAVLEFLKH